MHWQKPDIRVVISGGGTGGHIFPALAIAHALKKVNDRNEILFVGALGRMEMEKVPAAGYRIIGLNISGLQRSFTLSNLWVPFRALGSYFRARGILKSFRPHVAVGVGGYASGPLLFAATGMGIPSLIQEQNSYAGITNKLLGKRVRKVCVAYEHMERYFPVGKILMTGNPVREDIAVPGDKRAEAQQHFGLAPDRKTVLVIGGSLGARTINESMEAGLQDLHRENIQLIWQTGKHFISRAASAVQPFTAQGFSAHDFIRRMDLAYAAADVVISRAGASSVSELCLVGKPSILVPSPNVAEDHQARNARALVEKDAALMVLDSDAREWLIRVCIDLVKDEKRRGDLAVSIRKLALPGAAERIVEEIYSLAETR